MTTVAPPSFQDFGVEPAIARALGEHGISTPFPIQELTLPLALSGADIIGQARTGTGKTLAFGIPLLQRVNPDAEVVQGLVIVPTRELCLQVTGDLNQAGLHKDIDVVAAYGGRAIEPQISAIQDGAPVVVGTPGRLLDLFRRGVLRLGDVRTLVLDEADEMLDLGFLPDVEQLIAATGAQRQTLLFSATMPSQVVALARRYMSKPTFLRADFEQVQVGPETRQHFFSCHRMDKPAVLARILESPGRGLCVVFSRTKRMADVLAEELRERGIKAAPIHSDLRQEARERALQRFRDGTIDVLVATEVAARGLDITDVTHVVNYDCPDDEKMYLHRIGRTGRAGAAGVAVTLAVWNELARMEMIKKALDISDETHEVFSTSPILDELFDLPPRQPRGRAADADDAPPPRRESAPSGSEDGGQDAGPSRRRRGGRRRSGRGSDSTADSGARAPAAPEPVAEAPAPVEPQAAEPTQDAAEPVAAVDAAPSSPQATSTASSPVERVRSRLRRRLGRGRDASPAPEPAAADQTPPAPAEPVSETSTPEGPAAQPSEAASTEPPATGRVRVRRRTSTQVGSDDGTAVTRPAPAAKGTADETADAEATAPADDARTEVRERTRPPRRRQRRSTATDAAAPSPEEAGQTGQSGRSGRKDGGDRADRTATDRPTGGRPAQERSRRRGGHDRGRGRSDGEPRGGDSSSRRGDGTRSQRRGGRGSTTARTPRQPAEVVDADTARGTGRPRLTRPLVVDHLP